ncbi:hypothetical protein ACOCEA_14055 [Maribacter sp. CXY002]|uniref:hypothetical protein n=1 Tax=Maribacter luteocoastalis TaxID=3407671 RepID=UPI003B67EAF8
MKKNEPNSEIKKNIEELHWEIQDFKSNLQFINDEIAFMNNMLDSYIFEPDTPNLFERLQEYKAHLKKCTEKKQEVQNQISKHENNLGGLLERNEIPLDPIDFLKHEKLKNSIKNYMNDYQKLKTEFYNYTGGILKKHKP